MGKVQPGKTDRFFSISVWNENREQDEREKEREREAVQRQREIAVERHEISNEKPSKELSREI